MTGRTGMAEFIEDFLRVDFHQVDILYEEPKMPIECRHVNRVNYRNKRAPVLVEELEGFFFELAFAQFVHEPRPIDGFLPAFVALRGQLGDKFFGLRFVEFEHSCSLPGEWILLLL